MKIGNLDFGKYPLLLAPMEDVTDESFRLMCKEFGADMVYTEFVSSDALIRSVGKTMLKLNLLVINYCLNKTLLQNSKSNNNRHW